MPDWRLVLDRSLAVVVMAIFLRTRRLAALIIVHWTMDLTAAFLLIERARTKTKIALAKDSPRGQSPAYSLRRLYGTRLYLAARTAFLFTSLPSGVASDAAFASAGQLALSAIIAFSPSRISGSPPVKSSISFFQRAASACPFIPAGSSPNDACTSA